MGSCASSTNNSVSDIDNIKNVEDVNKIVKRDTDINSNLEQKAATDVQVLKLLDGHYNIIFGPDPNSALVKVENDKLLKIGDASIISYEMNEKESSTAEYGQVC